MSIQRWQRLPLRSDMDDEFIGRVMSMWDQKLDTCAMASALHEPEATVTLALHIGREARRAA